VQIQKPFFFCASFLFFFFSWSTQIYAQAPVPACRAIDTTSTQTIELVESGNYCLESDIAWTRSGPAILIRGENIHVDLKSHLIYGIKGLYGQIGMTVDGNAKNIVIEHGSIESMQVGIRATDVTRLDIAHLNVSDIAWIGMHVSGSQNSVSKSHFKNIGYIDDGENKDGYGIGMLAAGKKMRIEGNSFQSVTQQPGHSEEPAEGVSILISEGAEDFLIQENLLQAKAGHPTRAIGIWARATNITIAKNRFVNFESPILGAYLGDTQIFNNAFELASQGPSTFDRVGNRARFIAVAMSLTESSTAQLTKNTFVGYICPIQFFDAATPSMLAVKDNVVRWPKGRHFCKNVGAWYTPEAFGPVQAVKAAMH